MSNAFLKGTLVLTIGGIIVKVTGALNWIILSRVLSAEGIGLYQLAWPIYLLALSVSSAGIPVAIAILTAEKLAAHDYKGAARVFHVSLSVLVATGLAISFLMYFGAGWLIETRIVRDARAYHALTALAPAVFFVTMLASYRGYFQGWQMMMPTAVSQIVEQLVRVVTMLIFASLLLPQGLEYAAGGASFGAAPGAFFGWLVLLYYYRNLKSKFKEQTKNQDTSIVQESKTSIIKRIIRLSIPVSLASIMLPIVANLDLLIVPYRLEAAGFSVQQATEFFGHLTGMAVPLVNMATILTASLSTSLVPAISEAAALKSAETIYQRAATAMRIANLITIPSFIGLCILAEPVSTIFYGAPNAARPVSILAVGIFFLGIHQVTTGVLQGLSHTTIPVINMAAAAVVKVIMNWTLTAVPAFGIAGSAWATVADFGVAALLNIYFVKRYTGFGINIGETIKMAIAGLGMGGIVYAVYGLLAVYGALPATIVSLAAGGIVYAAILVLIGGLAEQDIRIIPFFGKYLATFFKKYNWLKK